jgi:hypothetical protein
MHEGTLSGVESYKALARVVRAWEIEKRPQVYQYGTGWLCEPLPSEVKHQLLGLMDRLQKREEKERGRVECQSNDDRWRELGVEVRCQQGDSNPNMPEFPLATHWLCRLTRGEAEMEMWFSKGSGLGKKAPGLGELMECLVDGSREVMDKGVDEWAEDMGFVVGSMKEFRNLQRSYQTCVDQQEGLKRLLGDELFEEIVG